MYVYIEIKNIQTNMKEILQSFFTVTALNYNSLYTSKLPVLENVNHPCQQFNKFTQNPQCLSGSPNNAANSPNQQILLDFLNPLTCS